ncbi:StAR-related lipid transfer protein 6, partial [Ophiophagus hannah]
MEIPPVKLFPFVYRPEYRSKWDKSLQSYKIVERIDQVILKTMSFQTHISMPCQWTAVDSHLSGKSPNFAAFYYFAISVVHPNLPPTPAYIRGTTFSSGYACLPLPGNPEHTKLMMVVQVDLGGFLMPSVINSVMPMSLINFVTDCKSGLKMLRQSGT